MTVIAVLVLSALIVLLALTHGIAFWLGWRFRDRKHRGDYIGLR